MDSAEEHLVQSTLSLTDTHLCAVPRSSPFLIRTMSVLWRQLVCGNGDPDLLWANPASHTPLRVHSFASILHLLGGSCLYFSKNGVTEVDGVRRWNMTALGHVIALVFDERNLFGEQALEAVDFEYWTGLLTPNSKLGKRKSPRKGRHVRNNFELFNEIHAQPSEELSDNDFLSSAAGELAGPARRRRSPSDRVLGGAPLSSAPLDRPDPNSTTGKLDTSTAKKSELKVDSKSDFQSFLRAAVADLSEDTDIVQKAKSGDQSGSAAAKSMIKAFRGVSADSSRRWMTMPAPGGLSTIRESEALSPIRESEGGDDFGTRAVDNFGISALTLTDIHEDQVTKPTEELDNRVAVQKQKKGVKQMRIPQKNKDKKEGSTDNDGSSSVPFLLKSDEEIETAGLPFLDVIGQSLGLRYVPTVVYFHFLRYSTS